MIFALFLFVLLTFIINLIVNKFDYVSPNSIVQIMALFMLLVLTLNYTSYDLSLSLTSGALFILSIVGFCLWGMIEPCSVSGIKRIETFKLYDKKVVWFSFFFILISTVLYFIEVKGIAEAIGYGSASPFGILFYYRNATLYYPEVMSQQSKIVGQLTIASFAIAYLLLIDIVKRIVYKQIKPHRLLFFVELLTVALFTIQCILSGGRTQFLYYVESLLFLLIFIYQKKRGRHINKRFLNKIVQLLIIAFASFYLLGSFTEKTSIFDFKTTLFVYVGAPLPAFDKLIQGIVQFPKTYFGSNVFLGIFDIVHRLGFNITVNEMTAPFVNIGGVDSNIYGAFGRYYADFGLIGVLIIPFVLGVLYQKLYRRLQKVNKNLELKLAIYLIMMQYVFDFCIEERFFLSVVSLGTILRVAYMVIFYKLFKMKECTNESAQIKGVIS